MAKKKVLVALRKLATELPEILTTRKICVGTSKGPTPETYYKHFEERRVPVNHYEALKGVYVKYGNDGVVKYAAEAIKLHLDTIKPA